MSISDLRGSVAMANIPCETLGDNHTRMLKGNNSLDGTQGNSAGKLFYIFRRSSYGEGAR